ncbi:hypothetical protein CKF54_05625 [Psittacicella hinzii]|uniref:Uncharacterized protein n=1 Tax=Psittacicella hinzii TaxID=2028575 RepID=A0A3A1Y439_9GAMM|nr:hypothetical protein [Psittacicella hinzii]RIY32069.1 hypothetical protein CKF54_05625 [Psittacicella hinzii]
MKETTKRQSTAANNRLQKLAQTLNTDYPFLPFQFELQDNYDLCTQEGKLQFLTDIEAYNQKVMAYFADQVQIIKSTYEDLVKSVSKERSELFSTLVIVEIREEYTINHLRRLIYDRDFLRNYNRPIRTFRNYMFEALANLGTSPEFTSVFVQLNLPSTTRGIYAIEGEFKFRFKEFVRSYYKYTAQLDKYSKEADLLHQEVRDLVNDLIEEMNSYYSKEEIHEVHDYVADEVTAAYNNWKNILVLFGDHYQENKPGILAIQTNGVLAELQDFIKYAKKAEIIDDALIKQVIGEYTPPSE